MQEILSTVDCHFMGPVVCISKSEINSGILDCVCGRKSIMTMETGLVKEMDKIFVQ